MVLRYAAYQRPRQDGYSDDKHQESEASSCCLQDMYDARPALPVSQDHSF